MQRVGVIRTLSKINPQNSLIAIYNSFVRSHLDYSNVLYYQPNNESFYTRKESFIPENGKSSVQCCSCHHGCDQRYVSDETFIMN